MNNYYLYKKLFENKNLIRELNPNKYNHLFKYQNNESDNDIMAAYDTRVRVIEHYLSTEAIKNLENLSGKDVMFLIAQRDSIMQALGQKKYAEMLIKENKYPFKNVLESLFEATEKEINEDYEEEEKEKKEKENEESKEW